MSGKIERRRRQAAKLVEEAGVPPDRARSVFEAPPPSPVVSPELQLAIDNIARWRLAPWEFVREVLGAEPDDWQMEGLVAIAKAVRGDPEAFTKFCFKACKGPGKTALEAWIILWFMMCFEHPKILATSVTAENLRDNLWAELATWMGKSNMLMAIFQLDGERLYAKDHKETWFCAARTWPKDADKSKQAATLAGLHGRHTMIIMDESGTIPIAVLAAALAHHSTQDPNASAREIHLTLQCGNPDLIDGALGWACTTDAKNWWIKEITGDPKDPHRAKRIDPLWAQEQIDTYGADNPWVLVNVFGRFPPVGANKLLGPDQIRKAMALHVDDSQWRKHARVMALDVARSTGRDRSSLCRRQGAVIFPFIVYRLDDANELAGQVAFEYARWPCQAIFIDAVGIGGPVADHLRAIGLPVIMFYGGQPARDKRFVNRRTETWWVSAQAVKGVSGVPEISLPNMPDLVVEGTAPNLEWNAKGQMMLESKETMLKRGLPSPDVWDSLAMTFSEPVEAPHEIPASTIASISRQSVVTEYDPYRDQE